MAAAKKTSKAAAKKTARRSTERFTTTGSTVIGGKGVKALVVPERRSAKPKVEHGEYFTSSNKDVKTFSSGCAVLDEALGGGIGRGRTINLVGDRSAGKTLNAMEAIANFCLVLLNGAVRYAESEAAFDMGYAKAMGMPVDRITFNADGMPMETVEDLYADMVSLLDANKGRPKLYVIDSLDALTMEEELDKDFNTASFGGAKPKALSQLFRRLIRRMEEEDMTFIVVSQIRDKMDAGPFQEKKTRSGGKALDFYCTHIVWLVEIGKLPQTIAGIKRVVGIEVQAKVRKNKLGLPFRDAQYTIVFGYGIDDMLASAEWLVKNNREKMLSEVDMSKGGYAMMLKSIRNKGGQEALDMRAKLAAIVRREWVLVERDFLPQASKY